MLNFLLTVIYEYYKYKYNEYPLSILYYHHVFAAKETFHPDDLCAEQFNEQIKFLNKYFNIISLDQAMHLLKQKKLPPKSLVLTFDDGYQDNYTIAAPILEKNNCTATFFIASQGVEQGYLWNDQIEQSLKSTTKNILPKSIINEELSIKTETEKVIAFNLLMNKLKFLSNEQRSKKIVKLSQELNVNQFTKTMMNSKQILDLHNKGFTIGAHTHSHTILSTETNENALTELSINKLYLEKVINSSVNFLAFPNGLYGRDFNKKHCDITNEIGFKAAFSTNDGGARNTTDLFQVPRFMPYRKQLSLFALSIAKIAGEHV